MRALPTVAALAAVLSVTAAFAGDYDTAKPGAESTGAPSSDYAKLDTNRDGNVSKDEAMADPTLSAKFDELDQDRSGSLSTTELSSGAEKSKDK
jgi:hypothetical protein